MCTDLIEQTTQQAPRKQCVNLTQCNDLAILQDPQPIANTPTLLAHVLKTDVDMHTYSGCTVHPFNT